FGGKIVGRVWMAHHRGKPIRRHVDTRNLLRGRAHACVSTHERSKCVFESIESRVDRITTGSQAEVVAADLSSRTQFLQQAIGPKAIPYQAAQRLLDGI